jgi:hypothetical protein
MAAVEVAVPAPKDAPRSNKFLLRNKEKLKMNQYWCVSRCGGGGDARARPTLHTRCARSAAFGSDTRRRLLTRSYAPCIRARPCRYSAATIEAMVADVEAEAKAAAFLSTPSVYFSLRDEVRTRRRHFARGAPRRPLIARANVAQNLRANSKLLDFDEAFARDPGFVKFDFKVGTGARCGGEARAETDAAAQAPDKIPAELEGRFDFVVIDPPFITTEVWEKYAAAARFLLAKGTEQRVVSANSRTRARDHE